MELLDVIRLGMNNHPNQVNGGLHQPVQQPQVHEEPSLPPLPPSLDAGFYSSIDQEPQVLEESSLPPLPPSLALCNFSMHQNLPVQEGPSMAPLPPSLDATFSFPMNHQNLMDGSISTADLMEIQMNELEQLLTAKNNHLREALQQKQQLMVSLMMDFQIKVINILNQKDEELKKALGQSSLLGQYLRNEIVEKENWKRIAKEKEALSIALSHAYEQVRNPIRSSTGANINEVAGMRFQQGGETSALERPNFIPCKACGCCNSCVLLIPCRHLCVCSICVRSVSACPICHSGKTGSIEVLLE